MATAAAAVAAIVVTIAVPALLPPAFLPLLPMVSFPIFFCLSSLENAAGWLAGYRQREVEEAGPPTTPFASAAATTERDPHA